MTRTSDWPRCIAICFCVGLAACETPTIYEPAPDTATPAVARQPSFTPGDEFWFQVDGTSILVEKFIGVEDGLLAFRREIENETRFYSPDMALVRIEPAFSEFEFIEPDDGELVFPLTVGDTWTRNYRLRTESSVYAGRHTRECEVLDRGQLTSQAGTFGVFRIACTLRDLDEAIPSRGEVLYAPEVGRIVYRRTLGGGTDLNLIEFTRAK